jgi:hypothetical protein
VSAPAKKSLAEPPRLYSPHRSHSQALLALTAGATASVQPCQVSGTLVGDNARNGADGGAIPKSDEPRAL